MTLRIEALSAQTLIQDNGRVGYAHLGVPRAGAFDRRSWRLANRLVGNHEDSAALEALGGGLDVRALTQITVAITGALGTVLVDERPRDVNTPLHLAPGQRLRLTTPHTGIRYYLAVSGGIQAGTVLGSSSHDTLGGIGPPPLAVGRILQTGPASSHPTVDHAVTRGLPTSFRVLPGPDATPPLLQALAHRTWDLDPQSNRTGVRLTGDPIPIGPENLPSKPMVLGAVQIPPNGLPIILGPDHPTTGGYPVVAVVTHDSMDDVAQWSGGIRRFIPVADATNST